MNKIFKIILLSLLLSGMCLAGTNKVLDLVLSGDFADVLGSELLTNGDFVNWTGGDPDDWTVTEVGDASSNIVEADADGTTPPAGGAGTGGHCRVISTGALAQIIQFKVVVGKTYLFTIDITAVGSGTLQLSNGSMPLQNWTTTGAKSKTFTATSTTIILKRTGTVDATFTNASVKEVLSSWIPGDEWTLDNTNADWLSQGDDDTLSQPTIKLVEGATYKVYVKVTNTSLTGAAYMAIQLGGGPDYQFTVDQTFDAAAPLYLVCGATISNGIEFVAVGGTTADTMTIDDVAVIVEHFKPSTNLDAIFVTGGLTVNAGADLPPNDEYAANGTHNGQTKYTSLRTHADGAGGAAQEWDLWWDGSTDWIISPDAGTKGSDHWKRTNANPIGDFIIVGNVTGIATVTNGPTDHSVPSQGGTAGLLTDGATGFVGLCTSYDYLSSIRETQWAVVSILKPFSGNDNTDRLISFETADNTGYFWTQAGVGAYNSKWTGTTSIDLNITGQSEDFIHSIGNASDVAVNDSWFGIDGVISDSQINAATLNNIDPINFVLGARADAGADYFNAQYGGQFILDLTSVITVDASWVLGLLQGIDNAAIRGLYDPDLIAAAIFTYDNNIDGFYFPINELASGDVSDYYLLAKDLPTQTEQTESFYGLVSPSGVEGVVIKSAIPRFRRRMKNTQ